MFGRKIPVLDDYMSLNILIDVRSDECNKCQEDAFITPYITLRNKKLEIHTSPLRNVSFHQSLEVAYCPFCGRKL